MLAVQEAVARCKLSEFEAAVGLTKKLEAKREVRRAGVIGSYVATRRPGFLACWVFMQQVQQ